MASSEHPSISGTTLKIYLFLVRYGRPIGVRELQRKLGLSSPSLAAYHLNKLVRLGLVEKDSEGRYVVKRIIGTPLLIHFMKLPGILVPRLLFYAIFATIITFFMIVYGPSLEAFLIALVTLVVMSFALWYETIRVWRLLRGKSY